MQIKKVKLEILLLSDDGTDVIGRARNADASMYQVEDYVPSHITDKLMEQAIDMYAEEFDNVTIKANIHAAMLEDMFFNEMRTELLVEIANMIIKEAYAQYKQQL